MDNAQPDTAVAETKLICNCCNANEALGVASSTFGPISFAYCWQCLEKPAEVESMFVYLYWYVGDHGEGLHERVKLYHTFKDGKYLTWDEWCAWAKTQPDPDDLDGYKVTADDDEDDSDGLS